jgi:hypothetical protein
MLGWPGTLCLAFETIRTTSHIPATPTPYTQTHTESLPSMTKATKATKTRTCWVGLVLYAWLVQVVPADGTCVGADGPRPHGHCIPLLDLKALAALGALLVC